MGGAAAAAVMVGLFLYLARVLLTGRSLPGEIRFVAALSGLLLAMALAAIALVATGGSAAARIGFGAVMVVGMVGEVAYLVLRCYRGALRPSEDGATVRTAAVPPIRAGDPAFDAAAADAATSAP